MMTRSTIHFSLSAPERPHNCAVPHEHGDIAGAIRAGKAAKAAKLMLAHLAGLVEMQSAPLPAPKHVSLEEAFRGV